MLTGNVTRCTLTGSTQRTADPYMCVCTSRAERCSQEMLRTAHSLGRHNILLIPICVCVCTSRAERCSQEMLRAAHSLDRHNVLLIPICVCVCTSRAEVLTGNVTPCTLTGSTQRRGGRTADPSSTSAPAPTLSEPSSHATRPRRVIGRKGRNGSAGAGGAVTLEWCITML